MSNDPKLMKTGSKFQTKVVSSIQICFSVSGLRPVPCEPPGGRNHRFPQPSRYSRTPLNRFPPCREASAGSGTAKIRPRRRCTPRRTAGIPPANGRISYSGSYFISCRPTFFNVNEKVLPAPSSLRTVIRSPWASTMCLTIARPSPVPPCSRERPLSVR